MDTTHSQEETQEILAWLNRNRRMLIDFYKNQYIAYNANGIIAHSENLREALDIAEASGQKFVIYFVPRSAGSVQILPIRFRAVVRHDWQPNYEVRLQHRDKVMNAVMLVDSGAELSLIPFETGEELGYALADSESKLIAETIGGKVEFVLRDIEMTINNKQFVAPVAWLQTDTGAAQLLLGREVVFDKFNIEFRQSEGKIIFHSVEAP
ncbi:hypothetical protein NIES4071_19660 [Calothrix sp. NIES-4071]|nr:hypothetical protein NIES4071_19660 [Calothrix sp. NIES-4071]BAZ56299.1 hypothetical protein NIES4105_19610 [Calothrix sp. NIES-4105]